MEKINTVTLSEWQGSAGANWDKIRILGDGIVDFDSYTYGSLPESAFGTDDHGDNIFVAPGWKDTLLLLILKEHFKSNFDFKNWATSIGLPYTTACTGTLVAEATPTGKPVDQSSFKIYSNGNPVPEHVRQMVIKMATYKGD